MKVTPIGERVLIKPLEKEEKTKSGLYLPKSEDKNQGIIEALPSHINPSILLQKGDKVIYSGYSHEEIEIEGKKFLIVELKDIVAKIE
jgi:chaperonin GroES